MLFLPCNVAAPDELEAVFDAIRTTWGRLDFLFHAIAWARKVMAAVQTAMLANLPYATLRDAVISHLTMAEGLGPLFANVPSR